ncbi:MFS transporter [Ideonella sp. 4Y16]|uniref:MFS transporter n=1 Tax=Ideonella alba TaxID=2824118 RepID=A0A940YKA9_9BURK|nr:MFS transporter [Ideonella alba]MBQ0931394.1 MFS transporter [Ideonella alba]MBQ0945018.1 MFS transporter [Ideonella alba]
MSDAALRRASWSLLAGNFAIGCGVMVVAGSLNDLTRSLQVSVAAAGQLITVAALAMSLGAPILAALCAGWDRRRLLALALAWYALGHAASALMPDYAALLPVRALSVLAAAVFTPQAAAAIAWMAPPERRGRAITFVFLGWSVASVLGMPLHSFIGETFGWRWAFGLVTLLSALSAWAVWRAVPEGVRPPSLGLDQWRELLTHPVLMAMVAVTALSGSGQFTLFAYFAPFYRQVLQADAAQISALFFWFGGFGLLGNVLLSRHVDRVGAGRAVAWSLAGMALSMALWPLAGQLWLMPLVLLPWALTGFASNSAQQARLSQAAPALAPALMALNTSAIYLGQALGAGGGGAVVAASLAAGQPPYVRLHWIALAWMLAAMALSHWVSRRIARDPTHV